MAASPPSLSVYRGQAARGIGEGPDRPISHGEQYLLGTDERLAADNGLLDTMRPWLTLDSDPLDHRKLGDQLEAWSCVSDGQWCIVARLVSAGTYDRRAAYFAHGRAWPAGALAGGFDPGAHLGRTEAFDPPPADGAVPVPQPVPAPAVVRLDQIRAEQAVAVALLGHLLQVLSQETALILAVPTLEFVPGAALHALVSFARAALPLSHKRACRVRVYTRAPDVFLGRLGAHLVVVPEELAGRALQARREATLLDRQGRKLAGAELRDDARRYAEAVLARALRLPEGLFAFTERVSVQGHDSPAWLDPRTVPLTYNLAFALDGPPERRASLLRTFLPRQARDTPGLPWHELVQPEEWARFPREALAELLLADASAGERELQAAVEDTLGQAGTLLGEVDLAGWWQAGDERKAVRLAALLAHEPPLVDLTTAARLLGRSDPSGVVALVRLPVARLLSLAEHWPDDADVLFENLYATIDERLRRRAPEPAAPDATLDALIASGWWYAWRKATTLDPATLRELALRWLTSACWTSTPNTPATLEAWTQVLDDLAESPLSGDEALRLCRVGDARRRAWPWIPPFQGRQIAGLCAHIGTRQVNGEFVGDYGAWAEIAESIHAELGDIPDATEPTSLLEVGRRAREFDPNLPIEGLLWLGEQSRPPYEQPLTLDESLILYERAGQRRDLALRARVVSVAAHLDRDPAAALRAALRPLLATSVSFLRRLRYWLLCPTKPDPVKAALTDADALLASADPALPRTVRQADLGPLYADAFFKEPPIENEQQRARQAADALYTAGHERTATLLDPGVAERQREGQRIEQAHEALAAGNASASCWSELTVVALSALARRWSPPPTAPSEWPDTRARRLKALEQILRTNARLLGTIEKRRLPALELAVAVAGSGSIGLAISCILRAYSRGAGALDRQWWHELLRGLLSSEWPLAGARDNRARAALALVEQVDLLGDFERAAFDEAVQALSSSTFQDLARDVGLLPARNLP